MKNHNPIVQFLGGKVLEIKPHDYKIEEESESVIKRQNTTNACMGNNYS